MVKTKIKIKSFIILFFTIIMLSSTAHVVRAKSVYPKSILIFHSYGEDFKWTRDISSGVVKALEHEAEGLIYSYEYMDIKKVKNEEYISGLYNLHKEKYKDRKFDVIICVDNDALEYLNKYGNTLFPDTPVIFCGINDFKDSYIENRNLFTGVIEETDIKGTLETIKTLQPDTKNIIVVCDSTTTGKINQEKIKSIIPQIQIKYNFVFLTDTSVYDLQEQVKSLDKGTVILHLGQLRDSENNILPYDKTGKLVNKYTTVANYGLWDFLMGEGIIGGKMTSGFEQGKLAGDIALRVIHGGLPKDIPIVGNDLNKYTFDYVELTKFDISLKSLPENSILINKKLSFYENYKELTITVVVIIGVLVTLVGVLLANIKKRKLSEKNLIESYNELNEVYEELSATEEELREQYENLQDMEEEARYRANHDELTGLRNRRFLMGILDQELRRLQVGTTGAVYFIDFDNFKNINDTLGHDYGDKLLVQIGKRLEEISEKGSYVFRLGGDEFVILKTDIQDYQHIASYADKIMSLFKNSFYIEEKQILITSSMGIVVYPNDGSSATDILKKADTAMYKAKDLGKDRYQFFNRNMFEDLIRRIDIEKGIREGLIKDEFKLYYQPKVDITRGVIVGMEALVRWISTDHGFVSPMEFIPIAEECGQIIPLGEWILRTACWEGRQWQEKGYGDIVVGVNISAAQLQHPNFFSTIKNILKETKLSPYLLEIEITESMLMKCFKTNIETLNKLKELGVRISLDDFGTGYSSLNYLRLLPIDTLKIDKSFVDDISNNKSEADIIDGIVQLAHKMNLKVIAEGVEEVHQLKVLKDIGCDEIQGYIFCKPVPKGEIDEVIKENKFKEIIKKLESS